MADNVNINEGSETGIATDQVGMVHYQKIKLADGEPDSGVMIKAGEGVKEAALRVIFASDSDETLNIASIKDFLDVLTDFVTPYAETDDIVSGAASSDIVDTTQTEIIPAQGEGISILVTSITVTNSDEDIGTVVKITDGMGGTAKFRAYAATDGGGFSVQFPTPIVFSPNTAVYAECETTGASVQVSISGYKE